MQKVKQATQEIKVISQKVWKRFLVMNLVLSLALATLIYLNKDVLYSDWRGKVHEATKPSILGNPPGANAEIEESTQSAIQKHTGGNLVAPEEVKKQYNDMNMTLLCHGDYVLTDSGATCYPFAQ